jgi:hypothetical protein
VLQVQVGVGLRFNWSSILIHDPALSPSKAPIESLSSCLVSCINSNQLSVFNLVHQFDIPWLCG